MRAALSLILILQSLIGFGQLFDTTEYRTDRSLYTTVQEIEDLRFEGHTEDSTLRFAHRLRPNSAVLDPAFIHLGRVASPQYSLEPEVAISRQFSLTQGLFLGWFFQSDQIQYFNSTTPRTHLKYSQGTGNLLYMEAKHSQNIAPNWSFGIDYRRVKTHNRYFNNLPLFNQERMTNMFSTDVYSHFHTRDHRYEVFGSFVNNKNSLRETHGISNSLIFDQLLGRAKTYSGTAYLEDAGNLFINREFAIHQFFRKKGRTIQVNDTLIVPDTTTDDITGHWFHHMTYTRNIYKFTDDNPNLDLYPIRQISLLTSDSIFNGTLTNRAGRAFVTNKVLVKYWLQHELISVKQIDFHNSNLQNIQLGGSMQSDSTPIGFQLNARYFAAGFNQGDGSIEGVLKKGFNAVKLSIGLLANLHRPSYNDQFFGSNYYYWNHRYNKIQTLAIRPELTIKSTQLKIGGEYRLSNNYVYYDTNGLPVQLSRERFGYLKAYVSNHFTIGRSNHYEHRLVYQQSGLSQLRVPDLIYKASLYREGYLFKQNMWIRFGFDLTYFSEFQGYTYNPVVRQFVLSNQNIGGYPAMDVFINARVRTMILTASMHHFGQGYFINDSFSAGEYPINGRAVRVGVEWRLFD